MGAAGAVEAVLTVQALRDGVVPPTLNLKTLTPKSIWMSWPARLATAITAGR